MKLESTIYSNHKLVIDEFDIPVAVQINGVEAFRLYDTVKVTDNGHGYISPDIKTTGFGRIVEIIRDNTDHFYGVLMDETNEFGYIKADRMTRIPR